MTISIASLGEAVANPGTVAAWRDALNTRDVLFTVTLDFLGDGAHLSTRGPFPTIIDSVVDYPVTLDALFEDIDPEIRSVHGAIADYRRVAGTLLGHAATHRPDVSPYVALRALKAITEHYGSLREPWVAVIGTDGEPFFPGVQIDLTFAEFVLSTDGSLLVREWDMEPGEPRYPWIHYESDTGPVVIDLFAADGETLLDLLHLD